MKVVLLHALPLDGSMWEDVAAGLDHEVVAPDLYQLGSTLEEWASGVLDLVGAGPLVVVGNSVGGSCAIEIARLASASVKHLVLIGAKPGHRPEPSYRDAALRLLEAKGMEAAWPAYWAPLIAPNALPNAVAAIRQIAFKQGVPEVVSGVRVFHGRPDRARFLGAWSGPVTVVSGQHDIAPARAKTLAESLRHGRFHLVQGAGHYVPMEAADQLRDILLDAIAQAGRNGTR